MTCVCVCGRGGEIERRLLFYARIGRNERVKFRPKMIFSAFFIIDENLNSVLN